MFTGYITPCWNMQQIKNLEYKDDYHKDTPLIKKYIDAGHSSKHITIYNYFEPNPMPDSSAQVKKHFKRLGNLSLAINKFTPGQYLPMHHDLYGNFKLLHCLDDDVAIIRIMVMMEDSSPGQILQIGDNSWSKWRAGEWMGWINTTEHASYNFSMSNRYAWQITGTI
jgi:hypothetical protein